MRILFTIPHFFGGGSGKHRSQGKNAESRMEALAKCIHSLHQHFGPQQDVLQIADKQAQSANCESKAELHIVVFTSGGKHVLDDLPVDANLYQHFPVDVDPMMLGFQCQRMLRDRWGNYDFYCYMEDDLILHDPWLFKKLTWFNKHVGNDKLLMPNRFEVSPSPQRHKGYVDGDLAPRVTQQWQDLSDKPELKSTVMGSTLFFKRPLNPHSGCYFLNAEQMAHWSRQKYFMDQDTSFIGPLESAATLGIMQAFKIYKPAPANANFLEVEHFGDQFLRLDWTSETP